ncbi:MAG TPA: hypothetical protein VLT45_11045 [Kofleriaceae bacterium]|nr:hypothetical protein [Kofleriaceae bacterium]
MRTIATRGTAEGSGIAELAKAVEAHRARVWQGEAGSERANARASAQVAELVRALLADRATQAMQRRGGMHEIAQAVVEKRRDPWSLAEELVEAL